MTDRFVAVGSSHKIGTSDDGVNWTNRTNGFANTIKCVRYGDDHWVAIDDSNNVGWSNDGITWNVTTGPFNVANALAFSGNEWIAVDDFGGVFRSIDGVSWTTQTTGLPGGGDAELMDVIWDASRSRFYAVGQDFTDGSAIILYSDDGGASWARHLTAPANFEFLNAVGSDGVGRIVIAEAFGGSGVANRIATSDDGGVTWITRLTPFTSTRSANRIVWGSDGSFVAPGSGGELAYSLDDGDTWLDATLSLGTSSLIDADYGPSLDLWVVVGAAGRIATSDDAGATWTQQTSFTAGLIDGVAFGATSSWEPAITFPADAVIKATISESFPADAEIVEFSYRVRTDAVLKASFSRTFSTDAAIAFSITDTQTGRNPHDRAEQHFGTMPATMVAYDQFTSVEQKLRYIWDRIALNESGSVKEGSFTVAAMLRKIVSRTLAANAVIGSGGPHSGSWLADAIMRRVQTGSFTAAADFKKTQAASATADAITRRNQPSSLTSDADILRTQTGSGLANAVIKKAAAGSFAADAYLFFGFMGSFTGDSIVKKTATGSFTADAVIDDGSGESGLLGDHTLGTHELGGD